MKKFLLFGLFTTMLIAIAACSGQLSDEQDQSKMFDSSEELLGFAAVSTVTAFEGFNRETTMQDSTFTMLSAQENPFDILAEIDELEPYLKLVETFMGSGSGFEVNVEASEHEDYEHTMQISVRDITGEMVTYTMHYNETIVDEDEEDGEYESVLEGIMIIGETTYELHGEREVEEEEEELKLTAKLDDENYVTLYYEVEDEDDEFESEFLYEMFVDNQLVKSIEIEFEQDDEETEMELKFIEGNKESEYEFEIERDGDETAISIEFKIVVDGTTVEEGDIEVIITFNQETGEYKVVYEIEVKDHGETTIEREYKPERDDEDNDDEDDEDDDDDEEDEDDDEDDDKEDDEIEDSTI